MNNSQKTYEYDVVVVGSGAAGFNAANRIAQVGTKRVAIVTEGINCGTSRNTGSDKQTYYKLSLSGDSADSVNLMAKNLFNGGAVDGDNALCEAALSTRCFSNLCELGVEFPCNRYGEYIGYKTDHDPYERATSAGPLTSKFMTEALQKQANKLNVPIFDNLYAVCVMHSDDVVFGLLCINEDNELILFNCPNVILATGGPAGIYRDSVYPKCHNGSTSLALLAGASLQNFTEWQYGLASVEPRWNVSGTYMQVLPRFVSVGSDGVEHEFLLEYFEDKNEALNNVFLKGYQWPFDSSKADDGSSLIDILVYRETALRNRKVYLDYMHNPFGIESINFDKLSDVSSTYLKAAGATQQLPIERLKHMNAPAYDLYHNKGVDLATEYLQIALCAQHNNGGIAVDAWWQTSVSGLFAVGECAGTHGVARPGGSALNAGQVGSLRAAQFILQSKAVPDNSKQFNEKSKEYLASYLKISADNNDFANSINVMIDEVRQIMSNNVAAIRNKDQVAEALKKLHELLEVVNANSRTISVDYFRLRDTIIVSQSLCVAILDYIENVGVSRGSAIYYNKNAKINTKLEQMFRFIPYDKSADKKIQEITLRNGDFLASWREVRPLPNEDNNFENVWASYRENKNVY